jgi:hypothetical protein
MGVKVHRHELEHIPVLLNAALKFWAALVRREGDSCYWPTRVVDRDGESAANPELCRLVEESALLF